MMQDKQDYRLILGHLVSSFILCVKNLRQMLCCTNIQYQFIQKSSFSKDVNYVEVCARGDINC